MAVSFQFKKEISPLFGIIQRPIAEVFIKHKTESIWQPVTMIVDTGADYTLLPHFFASLLGITISKDCKTIQTQGVGGTSKVYMVKEKLPVKLGEYKRTIPLGFLSSDYIPPLLGRHEFFETFKVVFENYSVIFNS